MEGRGILWELSMLSAQYSVDLNTILNGQLINNNNNNNNNNNKRQWIIGRRSEVKIIELILCSVSPVLAKNQVHMHLWAMKYELCLFRDSTCELNVLTFAFKTENAQCKVEQNSHQ